MPLKIGVMGGAAGATANDPETLALARQVGEAIAKSGNILVTGACPGVPQAAVEGAHDQHGIVIGISPADSAAAHVQEYHSPTEGYTAILYTGMGLMMRDVLNIRSCDMVVVIGGRGGTLNEEEIASKEGKPIGVLRNSGGTAAHLRGIKKELGEEIPQNMVFGSHPDKLVSDLIAVARKYPASFHVDGKVIDQPVKSDKG
jgi:hypothetical protein